jgi:hypothetical protein
VQTRTDGKGLRKKFRRGQKGKIQAKEQDIALCPKDL